MTSHDDLIFAHLDGDLDAAGQRELAARLRDDPAVRARLRELARLDARLGPVIASAPRPALTLRALPPSGRSLWLRPATLAAAALLMLALGAALLFTPLLTPAGLGLELLDGSLAADDRAPAAGQPIATGDRHSARLRLSATSTMTLQPATEVVVRAGESTRQAVDLRRGAARFSVVKGASKLTVATDAAEFTALGTAFTVRYLPDDPGTVELRVDSGRVKVAQRNLPGQQGSLEFGAGAVQQFSARDPVRLTPGKLVAVGPREVRLLIDNGQRTATYRVAPSCAIDLDGERIVLDDLPLGADLVVAHPPGDGAAVRIQARPPSLTGVFLGIEDRQVTVMTTGDATSSFDFVLDPAAEILIDGVPSDAARLPDYLVGMRTTLRFRFDRSAVDRVVIDTKQSPYRFGPGSPSRRLPGSGPAPGVL